MPLQGQSLGLAPPTPEETWNLHGLAEEMEFSERAVLEAITVATGLLDGATRVDLKLGRGQWTPQQAVPPGRT